MSEHHALRKIFPSGQRLFVLPQWKLVYVSLPKNACTSLKWLIAELGGEDLEAIRSGGLSYTPGMDGKIHLRSRWKVVPPLEAIDSGLWDEASTSEDWLVFGVIRDPRLRLFSAWQDKYLLRNPGYWHQWAAAGHPFPGSPEQVVDDFADFCAALATDAQHPAHRDHHFKAQVRALAPDVIPYRRLYDMSELGTLVGDLNAHLAAQGHPGGVSLARTNTSPFKACGALFEHGVESDIEKVYAEDFAAFGDRWDFSAVRDRPIPWTEESFAHARALIEVHERLAEVVDDARAMRRREVRLRKRVGRLRQRLRVVRGNNKRLRRRVRALEARRGVTGRVAALGRRVRRRAGTALGRR